MKAMISSALFVGAVVAVMVVAPSFGMTSDERREYVDLQTEYERASALMLRAQAQRDSIGATIAQGTRQAIATRQAVAAALTSEARLLAKAERETQATATAAFMQAQQTMDASNAQAMVNAMQVNATATGIMVYQQAIIAQQTSVAAQRQMEIDAALVETTKRNNELRAVILNYAVSAFGVALVVVVVWAAWQMIATFNHRKRIIESRAGTLALTNPRGLFTPFVLNTGEIVDWSAMSEAGVATAVPALPMPTPLSAEDQMRAEVLRLLRHSIEAIGDGARLATAREMQARGWTARQWHKVVRVLVSSGLAETRNDGTSLREGTARKLYDGVGSKAVTLRVPRVPRVPHAPHAKYSMRETGNEEGEG